MLLLYNRTHSKFRIANYLPSSFPIENGLKQRDFLSSLIFNVALKYAIMKVNGTHQALAYADSVNLVGFDMRTMWRKADVLSNTCKNIDVALNTGKTKCMEVGHHWGMMAIEHITIGSNLCEKVKTYNYLGSLLTNKNSIHEEIKCRLKTGNSCHYLVQTVSSSWLLSKNLKIKIYKTIILPVVLYGLWNMKYKIREELLRVLETRIIRWIFGAKRDENEEGELHAA